MFIGEMGISNVTLNEEFRESRFSNGQSLIYFFIEEWKV